MQHMPQALFDLREPHRRNSLAGQDNNVKAGGHAGFQYTVRFFYTAPLAVTKYRIANFFACGYTKAICLPAISQYDNRQVPVCCRLATFVNMLELVVFL